MIKKIACVLFMITGMAMFTVGADEITFMSTFCTSCHSMKPFHLSRKDSIHLLKKDHQIQCADCHVPEHIPARYFFKIKTGIKDVYKAMTIKDISPDYFDSKINKRSEFVFNGACLKCHVAGLENSKLPRGVIDIHEHIASGSAVNMNCVDCHGGMEHNRGKVFRWDQVKKFIHADRKEFEAENRKLEIIITKACIGCHLKDGAGLGGFDYFDFSCQPYNYLPLKIGIQFHGMPPTRTLRKYAISAMDELEAMVEKTGGNAGMKIAGNKINIPEYEQNISALYGSMWN